jgi:hypothetical protein
MIVPAKLVNRHNITDPDIRGLLVGYFGHGLVSARPLPQL